MRSSREKKWMLSLTTMIAAMVFLTAAVTGYDAENDGAVKQEKIMAKGVLERFEAGEAVILIERFGEEVVIDKTNLPKGSRINMWFNMEKNDGEWSVLSIDQQITNEKVNRIRELMEELGE
ncbi:DUF3006 domain-containing protein [Lentibacillus sediminis]|uniref:DUF3006 domain-containing protein n=1 Tax=Lentibacillus sediminis TaxID=1940529 RepID=UPI000C1BEC71|nr:DUF3006 domain-containing protein [Lentibacillus sediminis]